MFDLRSPTASALIIPLGALLLASCTDGNDPNDTPVTVSPTAPRSALDRSAPRAVTLDEKYARVDSAVSGFGGFFVDERGTPVVWLRDGTRRATVITALRAEFAELPDLARLEVRSSKHDYRELVKWRALIPSVPLVDRARITFVDIDERTNQLALGVRNDVDIGSVKATLSKLGVPPGAVRVFRLPPMTFGTTNLSLGDTINPIVGGVRVHNPETGSCSAGFAVDLDYVPYVATASHCSSSKGIVNSADTLYQPTHVYGGLSKEYLRIGPEAIDVPPHPASWFPAGLCTHSYCRYADISLFRYINTMRTRNFGTATSQSTGYFGAWGDTLYASSYNWSPSIFEPSNFVSGYTQVLKTGKVTGTTRGVITTTCYEYGVPDDIHGGEMGQSCMYDANFGSSGGDSGAPVWAETCCSIKLAGVISLVGGTVGGFTTVRGFLNDYGGYSQFKIAP